MRLLTAAALALGLLTTPAMAAEAPLMTVLIKPSRMSEAAGGKVEVTVTVPAMDVAAGQPLFALPTMAPGMPSPQPREDLTITDAEGAVPLANYTPTTSDAWTATRRVHGEVTVRYTLPIDNARGSGPPINLRVDGDGFSSPGRMLLAVPQTEAAYRVALKWDLAAMGPGAVGISSYGDGDATIAAGKPSRLTRVMFMAGHPKREPADGGSSFSASWLADPPFDPRPMLKWTGELHSWMSKFFKDEEEPPYRVFIRSNPQNPGGGVAMHQAFMVGYGPETTAESLKSILGHEMTHTWTSTGEVLGKWYAEGNAVYYQALLPWRAGMITTDQYLADVNRVAARYYANPKKHASEAEATARFWDDGFVRVLPYDRGAMYFAVLNGQVKRASGGQRSIDDLIREMIVRERRGQEISDAVWIDLLRREIGEEGPKIHAAMISGEGLMLPQSDDFGPCFRRVARTIRVFEPGFDITGMSMGQARVVKGLKAGSEAAKAGLRDGDQIVAAPLGDKAQLNHQAPVTVKVTREGKPLSFTYLPRGEPVEIYQWERVSGVPESACS